MSNYHLQPADKPQALTPQALRSLRQDPVQGISRRTLLRRSIGGATLLWLTEVAAGSIGFLWPNARGGFGSDGRDRDDRRHQGGRTRRCRSRRASRSTTRRPGRTSMLIDPSRQEFVPGEDTTGDGDGAQRPRAVPALPAPRLQAEPVPQELLVGVPVPRLALRPPRASRRRARSTARRRAAWTASRSRSTLTACSSSTRRRSRSGRCRSRSASRGSSRRRAPSAAYDRREPGPPRRRAGAAPPRAPPAQRARPEPVRGAIHRAPLHPGDRGPHLGAGREDRPPVRRRALGRVPRRRRSSRCS